MAIYFVSFFCCYLVGISKQRNNALIRSGLVLFLALFLCSGFMCGSDWRSYEQMYYEIDFHNYFANYFSEPGFYIYMSIFRWLNWDFWDVSLITKLGCFFIMVKCLKQYLAGDVFIGLMYFLPWYAFYLFIDCPMRNLMAIAVFIVAFQYLIRRQFVKYLFFIVLSTSFHFTAFIFIFLYWGIQRKWSTPICVCAFLIVNIFLSSKSVVINLSSLLFGGIPYIAGKMEGYLLDENEYAGGHLFSLGMIVHLLFFILLLYKRDFIEKGKNGCFIFNLAICYLLLYRLATTVEIFGRFQLYLSPFFCISIVYIARSFAYKTRMLYVAYLLCLSMISSQKIFSDYRYIPYSTYLPYILDKNYPSFEERDAYNFKYSPYVKE